MGTPEFAVASLTSLYEAGHGLPLVITQPDRARGRGQKTAFSPVKAYALDKGLELYQPDTLHEPEVLERIRNAEPDVIVVAAYGKQLPPDMLEAAPLGCINVHTSLLPAYRGAAPIQWVLLNGEKETGVTIMQMDEGIDTGPILMQKRMPIPENMDYGSLVATLAEQGAELLLNTLPLWADGHLRPMDQPAAGITYAPLLQRRHERIDWTCPAEAIRNQIRAFCPSPGAFTYVGDREIKILGAQALPDEGASPQGEATRRDAQGQSPGQTQGRGPEQEQGRGPEQAPGHEPMQAPGHEPMQAPGQAPGQAQGCGPVQEPEQAPMHVPGQILGFVRGKGLIVATGEGRLLITTVQPEGKAPMDAWAWKNGSRVEAGQVFGHAQAGRTDGVCGT